MSKKKYLAIASALLLTVGMFPASSNAQVATKNVQAKYNNIKVLYNGQAVNTDIEPFIINGTTYIPLRMMAGVFNKDIAWNGTNYTISVTDKADAQTQAKLAAKEAEIATLQSKIDSLNRKVSDLQDELDKKDKKSSSSKVSTRISDLEDQLIDDYGEYEDLEWDFSLDGDEDEIDVEIAIDFSEFEDDFNDLTKTQLKNLVEDVVNDIWDEFDEADINGTIVDSDSDDEQYEFEGNVDDEEITFDGKAI